MLKTLLKKDLLSLVVAITMDRKKGRKRSTAGVIGFTILFVIVFASLGFAFFSYSLVLGDAIGTGSWIYMSMIGCMGLLLGLFGSVFSSYTTLYKAKDNELLLSLPIPAGKLLLAKIGTVYAMSLLFCTLGMLPGLIFSWIERSVSPLGIVLSILEIFFTALLVTALSCVLGWLVALIVGLFPNKNAVTVVATLVFLVVYYTFYFKIQQILQNIIANVDAIENGIKGYAYPIYALGRGATGHLQSFLFYALICLVIFAIVYLVLSHSFIRITTRTEKQHVKEYREKTSRNAGAPAALLRKEFLRFKGSAVYMLNCGLGTVLMLAAAVFLLIKMKDVREFMVLLEQGGMDFILSYVPLIIGAAMMFIASMNYLTAPSISLEAKTLWLARSLPVETTAIFASKKRLHTVLTLIPALILYAAAAFVFKLDLCAAIAGLLLTIFFVLFAGAAGLMMNLKMPNLNWTNETIAVKQSGSVLAVLFGGWVLILAVAAVYWFLLRKVMSPLAFLYALAAFFLVLTLLVELWLRKRGVKTFEAL